MENYEIRIGTGWWCMDAADQQSTSERVKTLKLFRVHDEIEWRDGHNVLDPLEETRKGGLLAWAYAPISEEEFPGQWIKESRGPFFAKGYEECPPEVKKAFLAAYDAYIK